jgi:hypothetical protein
MLFITNSCLSQLKISSRATACFSSLVRVARKDVGATTYIQLALAYTDGLSRKLHFREGQPVRTLPSSSVLRRSELVQSNVHVVGQTRMHAAMQRYALSAHRTSRSCMAYLRGYGRLKVSNNAIAVVVESGCLRGGYTWGPKYVSCSCIYLNRPLVYQYSCFCRRSRQE